MNFEDKLTELVEGIIESVIEDSITHCIDEHREDIADKV